MAERNLKKRQPAGDDARPFINLPWTQVQEADYEEWLRDGASEHETLDLLGRILASEWSLKFSLYDGSWCATVENPARKASNTAYLLSGWSDTWQDALAVAYFKLFHLMEGDWDHPFAGPRPSRRR
jgi:hypothetical protein